jgi:rhodanese-related sulfurtransferase
MGDEHGHVDTNVREIDRDELQRLVDEGAAQLVEVLPAGDYRDEHLPGALSIPLKELGAQAERLDPARPVVVYCYDYQ